MVVENNTDITVIVRKLQEFELLKKLILDKDQEYLFNKIPKPNLLEVVDEHYSIQNEAKKLLEEETDSKDDYLKPNSFDSPNMNISDRGERVEREIGSYPERERNQIQEIYDRLDRNRTKSALNDKLLLALEEYVVKNRSENEESERDKQPKDRSKPFQNEPDIL